MAAGEWPAKMAGRTRCTCFNCRNAAARQNPTQLSDTSAGIFIYRSSIFDSIRSRDPIYSRKVGTRSSGGGSRLGFVFTTKVDFLALSKRFAPPSLSVGLWSRPRNTSFSPLPLIASFRLLSAEEDVVTLTAPPTRIANTANTAPARGLDLQTVRATPRKLFLRNLT